MIGNVDTLNPGEPATASTSIDPEQDIVYFNFGIPKGDKGDTGDTNLTTFNIVDGELKAYDDKGVIYNLGTVAMEPKGEYDAEANYKKLNTVLYNDSTYMAKEDVVGENPSTSSKWQLIGGGLQKEDIIDNLESNDATKMLSAKQGKVLNESKIHVFDTVALMKAANLKNGMVAETLGYYSANDGGEAIYKITNEEDSNSIQEQLDSGLYATLIVFNKILNIKQVGAKGDGETDDTDAINKAINYFHVGTDADNQNYATVLLANYPDAGGTIYFPKGVYCISSTIKIPCYVDVDFGYSTIKAISGGTFTNNYMFSVNSYSLSSWTYAYVGRKGFIKNATIDGNDISNICGFYVFDPHKIENIIFNKLYNSLKFGSGASIYIDGINVDRLDILNAKGTEYQIQKPCQGENTYFSNITFEVNNVNGIKISNGRNGSIQNVINGNIYLFNTEDYTLSNWHCEKGYFEGYASNNTIIRDCNIYVRENSTPISFTGGDDNNSLRNNHLENVKFIYYLTLDEFNYDTKDIDLSHYNGHIFIKGCYREQWTKGANAFAQSGIQYYNGSNYIPIPYDECEIYYKNIIPKNSTVRTDIYTFNGLDFANNVDWNLETGTYYYKTINFGDIEKLCGKIANERNINISDTTKGARLVVGNLGHGNILRIYRGTTSGTYTHYVDIPAPKNINLYDNGYSVNGYKWKSVDTAVDTTNTIKQIERIDIFGETLVRCRGYSSPTVGTWAKGDIVERLNPSANGNLGWVCIESGTPGTWKEYGTIQS